VQDDNAATLACWISAISHRTDCASDALSRGFPHLPKFWSAIKERLSMTGHREGAALPRGKPGWRLYVDDGALDVGLPRVKVIYRALGDTLTIYMVAIG